MLKRRWDARTYRAWHLAQAKPKKVKVSCGFVPGQGKMISQYHCDKLDAGCSREGDINSERFQLQQQRNKDSEVKSQLSKGEAILEQPVPTAPQDPSDNSDMMISLDSASDGKSTEEVNGEGDYESHRLEKKRSRPRFIEYWVPVGFSHLQLEKYCEILIKHSWLLCANTRKNVTDGLRDVLTRIKECCDHPYLVDSSLESFVKERRPVVDFLNTGTEASGKLLLLDKLLQESRGKGLSVVIVFQQSKHSKSHSVELRHLLNDFICGKFGEDSYVHIYRDVDRSKNQTALDLFNDKGSGRFVMLMEMCCCQPRIKLSSVDSIILFNSDWSPINDMKCLRKMSIQSTHDHLKVFRLYSPNSVEEKVLSLAKEGTVFDTCLHSPSYNVGHLLLLWGVPYLFSKLEDFHRHCSSIVNLTSLAEEKLVLTAKDELYMLLSCPDDNSYSFSIVSKLPEGNDYVSSSIKLYGERDALARDDDIPPQAIWRSLLEGRNPHWRLLPGSSDAIRRRGEVSTSLSLYAECDDESIRTTSKRTLLFQDKFIRKKLRSPKVLRRKACKSGNPDPGGRANGRSSHRDGCNGSVAIQNTRLRKMRELIAKQKKQIREYYSSKQDERAKLDEEHQLELSLINQGCGVGAREGELKKLEDIYEKKLIKHNHQMHMKWKEMEATLRAERIKETRFIDKLISLLKSKNDKKHIIAPVNSSVLGLQSNDLTKNASDTVVMMLDPASFSEGKTNEESEPGERDNSIQLRNPDLPDSLMTEKEILLAESNGGKDAVSMLSVAGSSTSDHDDRLLDPSVTASVTVAHTEKQSQDMQPDPNSDEGNSCMYSEHCKETKQGITVEKQPSENPEHCKETMQGITVEQPIGSVCPPSTMIRQNSAALCVSNYPTSQIHSCEPDQSDALLRNSGLGNLPVSEPQPRSDHFQAPLQEPTASGTTVLESANNYVQDLWSVRSNRSSFGECDPLANELKRISREEEELIKIYEDKTMQLNCACQKEIEEVHKKYDLLLQKADAELLEKKVALESICKKVKAHKQLAETLMYQDQTPQTVLASQGVIMNAILEPSLLQQCNMSAPRAVPASLQSTVPTTTPQVVHQLSDLMSMVPPRPHCPSTLHTTRNPQACYPVWGPVRGPAPHLSNRALGSPMPILNISSPFTALPNQQLPVQSHGLLSGWPQQHFFCSPASDLWQYR